MGEPGVHCTPGENSLGRLAISVQQQPIQLGDYQTRVLKVGTGLLNFQKLVDAKVDKHL